jgi:uncharacterized protein (TIGR02118 family)
MTTSYFVLYSGRADDPKGFVERYRTVHVPILRQWPGIRSIVLHTPQPWSDCHPVRRSGLALAAQMIFDDVDALQHALHSEQRAEARADFHDFPPFHGDVFHQAMQTERLL